MTPAAAPAAFSFGRSARGRLRVRSTNGYVAAAALVIAGGGLAASALVTAVDDWREVTPLGAMAALCLATGAVGLQIFVLAPRLRTAQAFAAVAAVFATFIAVSTVTYLLVGTFGRVDDALFESTSGFTTNALSVLDRPEATARGVLFWRALTQWIGAYTSLVVVVALLPFLGVGGLEVSEINRSTGSFGLLPSRVRAQMRRLGITYLGLTVVGIGLFAVGGMGPFDSITYALTTISTGGFANHAGSFAFFDSALIEWLAIGGMGLAGANIALLARTLRGQLGPLQRSAEVRVYVGLVVGGSALTYWWASATVGHGLEPFRHAMFSVVSVVSTTGASATDWGAWPVGPQVLLLLLIGVGSMSGSTGGGFRIIRVMALVGYVRREVVRQLHPRSVVVVKVGRMGLSETIVARLIGYQILFVVVTGAAAFAIAAFDTELVTAVSGAISVMSSVGPALGDLSPGGGARALTAEARVVLLPVMLLGRLEIAPVVVGLGGLLGTAGLRRRAARRWHRIVRAGGS